MKGNGLDVKAFAIAAGVTCGIGCLVLGWLAMFGTGVEFVELLASFYIGYKPTFFGAVIGGIYGLIDGGVTGALFAWIYNSVLN